METFLLIALMVTLFIRWAYLRDRLEAIDQRIDALAAAVSAAPRVAPAPREAPATPPPPRPVVETPVTPPPPRPVAAETPVAPPPRPSAPPPPPPRPEPQFTPAPAFTAAAEPQRSSAEWEALLGGNWLNKIGVFILVVGIALGLAYAYSYLSPAGRVALSLAISAAMLVSGVAVERLERYRIFAYGLIGGGWAALYFTVYAMHALAPARVIESPWTGAFLLIAVATGMIAHSLRYRSQTVTGLAYFIAFATLAITDVTALSLGALIPLAASLLYIARRFRWSRMALFGLIATYAVCATRPDTGAPLWQAQTIFAIYWLLFEAFDILNPDRFLLPLNAIGFLGLSIYKWQEAAPLTLWQFFAAASIAYLAGAILRARSARWHLPITLTAALAAIAIFLKLDHQWIALALLIEAELFYLAGVRLRADYLRTLAALLFGVHVAQLLAGEVGQIPLRHWTPIAALTAAVFYINRALRAADVLYGFAAAGIAALVAGFETAEPYRATVWLLMALVPFALGWWRRLADFRLQGYLLTFLGLFGAAWDWSRLSLSVAAAVTYGLSLAVLLSPDDRLWEDERSVVSIVGSLAAAIATATLIWRIVPVEYLGVSWMAMALLLLELGLRGLPKYFCRQAYALAVAGAAISYGPWEHRWVPVACSLLAYAMAARARQEESGAVLAGASLAGTAYAMAALWALLPPYAVAPAWIGLALVLAWFEAPILRIQTHLVSLAAFGATLLLNFDAPHRLPAVACVMAAHYGLAWHTRQRFYLYTGALLAVALPHYELSYTWGVAAWAAIALALLLVARRWHIADFQWQSYALAALAFVRCWYVNFDGARSPLAVGAVVIVCFYAAQLLSRRDDPARLYYSLLATTLTSLLPYYRVADSLRTVVWGIEGVVLLAAGFPLLDRALRLSGLTLLLGCILKLFLWDLRHLETLPRILSFIVLGLFLVGVSWIYTRFRERVAQYL